LLIFDLSRGGFEELLETKSREQFEDQDWFTQVLDVERTRQRRGEGVDSHAARTRNSWLERQR